LKVQRRHAAPVCQGELQVQLFKVIAAEDVIGLSSRAPAFSLGD
jgi:hypothetical protein